MTKILLTLSLILGVFLNVDATERIIHSYIYHGLNVYDRDFNLQEEIPSTNGDPLGLFLVAEINDEKYLSVTIGKETVYEFKIVLSKTNIEDDGTSTDVYAGGMNVEGHTVTLQVFVCYSRSSIPDAILIDVMKSSTIIELNKIVKTGNKLDS